MKERIAPGTVVELTDSALKRANEIRGLRPGQRGVTAGSFTSYSSSSIWYVIKVWNWSNSMWDSNNTDERVIRKHGFDTRKCYIFDTSEFRILGKEHASPSGEQPPLFEEGT